MRLSIKNVPILACFCVLSLRNCSSFTVSGRRRQGGTTSSVVMRVSASDTARMLLYEDQQKAMLRRAEEEEELLKSAKVSELKAPKLKATVQRGTGFGSKMQDEKTRLAAQQAKVVRKDGVLRIDNVLSPELADKLLEYLLEQQSLAAVATEADPSLSRSFYGVEQARANRCDLQLSLLRGGFAADNAPQENFSSSPHFLADALQELLGENGTLRALYENLVTLEGEFYELAAVITNPGSNRQIMHADLPFKEKAPLYVIFLALQDVDVEMGPTAFLIRTHTSQENVKHNDPSQKDEQLLNADCRLATINKGDAVLFDARVLHSGTANHPIKGKTRAMFNFSFRNPEVTGSLGYDGSIRPGYCQTMTLGDVSDALISYKNGDLDPFAKYGTGLHKKY